MRHRLLGQEKLCVSALGFGGPSFVGQPSADYEKNAIAVLHRAVDLGVTFFDCADHNEGNNEYILAKAFKGRWQDIILTTKIGNRRSWPGEKRAADGRPESLVRFCEGSLEQLGADHIDLLSLHRVDPLVPIEESVGALKRMVEAGKVRHIELSEAGPESLRRAAAVHPITSVQSEYSLWFRDYEADTIPAARALGIGFVAYNPMGKGFLAGAIDRKSKESARRLPPRLQGENFDSNLSLFDRLKELAATKGSTTGQLGLAWLLAQGDFIVPIPGTSSLAHLEENCAAEALSLDAGDLAAIESIFPRLGAVAGPRFEEDRSHELNI